MTSSFTFKSPNTALNVKVGKKNEKVMLSFVICLEEQRTEIWLQKSNLFTLLRQFYLLDARLSGNQVPY